MEELNEYSLIIAIDACELAILEDSLGMVLKDDYINIAGAKTILWLIDAKLKRMEEEYEETV